MGPGIHRCPKGSEEGPTVASSSPWSMEQVSSKLKKTEVIATPSPSDDYMSHSSASPRLTQQMLQSCLETPLTCCRIGLGPPARNMKI